MVKILHRVNTALLGVLVAAQAGSLQQPGATRDAARLGLLAGALLGPCVAGAQGFIQGFQNLNQLTQIATGLVIGLGLLGGLGMVLGGLVTMWNKYNDRGSQDSSWAKIGIQITAGGFAMALGWVGLNVVETLGGSSSDIGRSITR